MFHFGNIHEEFFGWGVNQQTCFDNIKENFVNSSVLHLPDFNLPFEVAADASGIEIGGVLSQNDHPMEYFSKNSALQDKIGVLMNKNCIS